MSDGARYRALMRLIWPRSSLAWPRVAISSFFASLALAGIVILQSPLEDAILVPSLGGSAVIAFGMPNSEMAKPRSLLGGHVLSCFIGILVSAYLQPSPWAGALAVGAALAVMQLTSTIHSPAGSDPLIILASNGAWQRPASVLIVGLLIIALVAQLLRLLKTRGGDPTSY
jgi:CBS-domain-containing membrane protein